MSLLVFQKFTSSDELCVDEIGDGNLNVVLRVCSKDGRSIIIKHSLPYIKVLVVFSSNFL